MSIFLKDIVISVKKSQAFYIDSIMSTIPTSNEDSYWCTYNLAI